MSSPTRPGDPGPAQPALERKIGPLQATAINMTQMCGIGPFVTIPAMVATIGGPQAMFGWIIGAILALADGLIWAELGAAMPGAGGTYIYLREAFQYRTGRLMPFLFVWSAVLFIPLIMSTGIIGLVQYLGYLIPGVTDDGGNTALGKIIGVGITLRDHGGAVPQDRPDRQAHHRAVRGHAGRGAQHDRRRVQPLQRRAGVRLHPRRVRLAGTAPSGRASAPA